MRGLIDVLMKNQWTNAEVLIPSPVCVCVHDFQHAIDELKHQEADLQKQMKEQCDDYEELLSEKMARDMEITAYRSGQPPAMCLIIQFCLVFLFV